MTRTKPPISASERKNASWFLLLQAGPMISMMTLQGSESIHRQTKLPRLNADTKSGHHRCSSQSESSP
ncbi:MAG: hypothetical protein ACPHF4_00790, partial [Rubripirellula sp.]